MKNYFYLCIRETNKVITNLKQMIMEKTMLLGREVVFTTDFSVFKNIPCIKGNGGVISLYMPMLPSNIVLGKTYYFLNEGDLMAFRIKAYTFISTGTHCTLSALVETPQGTFWSTTILSRKIFESVEDYYTYLASGKGLLNINSQRLTLHGSTSLCFKKTYYWNKSCSRPMVTETRMHYILITDTKIYVGIDYTHAQYGVKEQGFMSGEDCIKANIEGMKIIEFAEPQININITIEEPTEPKVRVLKFIDC